jgi:hypothetical protein
MAYHYKRKKVHGTKGYDDSVSRQKTIEFLKEVYDIDAVSTPPKEKTIDLIDYNDPAMGYEVEHAESCIGVFWDKKNIGLNTLSNMGFPTVNLPWWRKYIYWTEGFDVGWDKNMYLRWNSDYTSVIVITADVILDRKKSLDATFRTYKITTGDVEQWKCFKREHVLTYVKIDGKWEIDKKYELQ